MSHYIHPLENQPWPRYGKTNFFLLFFDHHTAFNNLYSIIHMKLFLNLYSIIDMRLCLNLYSCLLSPGYLFFHSPNQLNYFSPSNLQHMLLILYIYYDHFSIHRQFSYITITYFPHLSNFYFCNIHFDHDFFST